MGESISIPTEYDERSILDDKYFEQKTEAIEKYSFMVFFQFLEIFRFLEKREYC